MEPTVAACGIGYVPKCIGTGGVLQRAAAQGISITERILGAVATLCRVGILAGPFPSCKYAWIEPVFQYSVGLFLCILSLKILIANGIKQSCTIYANGRFQAHFIVAHIITAISDINCILWNSNGRITQLISFSVGESITPRVGIFCPGYIDFSLVKRGFKWSYSLGLRHACKPRHIGIGSGVIYHKQVAIAYVGRIKRSRRLAFAMPVSGVTMLARRAYV